MAPVFVTTLSKFLYSCRAAQHVQLSYCMSHLEDPLSSSRFFDLFFCWHSFPYISCCFCPSVRSAFNVIGHYSLSRASPDFSVLFISLKQFVWLPSARISSASFLGLWLICVLSSMAVTGHRVAEVCVWTSVYHICALMQGSANFFRTGAGFHVSVSGWQTTFINEENTWG